jgi:hypothetical protein
MQADGTCATFGREGQDAIRSRPGSRAGRPAPAILRPRADDARSSAGAPLVSSFERSFLDAANNPGDGTKSRGALNVQPHKFRAGPKGTSAGASKQINRSIACPQLGSKTTPPGLILGEVRRAPDYVDKQPDKRSNESPQVLVSTSSRQASAAQG